MVTTSVPLPLPQAAPFDAVDREVLADVSLRAELLGRRLELLRVIGPPERGPELRKLEGLLDLAARRIDGLLAAGQHQPQGGSA